MTELQLRHQEIEATVLTEEEISYAIWSAKAKKWSAERNKEHWQELEQQKPEQDGMRTVRKSKSRKPGSDVMRYVQSDGKEVR